MKHHRLLIWIPLALLLAVVIGLGLRPQAVLVETEVAQSKTMRVTIDEEGRSRVMDRYIVSAPVAGFIRRVEWKVGDSLQKDDLLTELEPLRSDVLDPRRRAEAEARVAAARSALLSAEQQAAAAKADADFSASEYKRKEELGHNNTISREEVELALAADQRARAMFWTGRLLPGGACRSKERGARRSFPLGVGPRSSCVRTGSCYHVSDAKFDRRDPSVT